MTDAEIQALVEQKVNAVRQGMVDVTRLPRVESSEGMTLPVVVGGRLAVAQTQNSGGGGSVDIGWYEGD